MTVRGLINFLESTKEVMPKDVDIKIFMYNGHADERLYIIGMNYKTHEFYAITDNPNSYSGKVTYFCKDYTTRDSILRVLQSCSKGDLIQERNISVYDLQSKKDYGIADVAFSVKENRISLGLKLL